MAKKTVATLGKGGAKDITLVIKTVKSPKTGAYMFDEKFVPTSKVNEFIGK